MVFSWHVDGETYHILMMLDAATKFAQARILKKDPSAKDVCNLMEEAWIAWAGRPEKLRVDEDGPHTGHEFLNG